MVTCSITQLRADGFNLVENTVRYNEELTITTKAGHAVLISKDEYRSLVETVYLLSLPGMGEKIVAGLATDLEDCLPESEVVW